MKWTSYRLAVASILLTVTAASAQAFEILGLRPGMTLAEVQALPTPGGDTSTQRRVGCMNEPALEGKMVGVSKSQVERETAAGIITCLVIERDPYNTDYAAIATPPFAGVNTAVWLPFVDKGGTPVLAAIILHPASAKDEKSMPIAMQKLLGKAIIVEREGASLIAGNLIEKVSSWRTAEGVVDMEKDGNLAFYQQPLAELLRERFKKIPGGSFFFRLP